MYSQAEKTEKALKNQGEIIIFRSVKVVFLSFFFFFATLRLFLFTIICACILVFLSSKSSVFSGCELLASAGDE